MAMSIVELTRHSLPTTWEGRNGTRFASCETSGKGWLIALVYTVCEDGTRVPFDTVDLHGEDNVVVAFDAWRAKRTGYAAEVTA